MHTEVPQHVLLATDLGAASETALTFAGELATSLGTKLTLFHAVAPMLLFDFGAWDARYVQLAADRQTEQAEKELLKSRADSLDDALEVAILVRDVNPVQGILETAVEKDCDLIVLGTHAWGPITSFFLGSVTQSVLHHSDIPVLTVRPRASEEDLEIRSILCPVNFSEVAHASLLYASMLAKQTGAELQVLHLLEPGAKGSDVSIAEWLPENLPSENVRTLTHTGHAAEKVVEHATDEGIDLIVLGAQHKRFFDTTVLGTTTERVVRHAPCAVMAVTMKAVETNSESRTGAA